MECRGHDADQRGNRAPRDELFLGRKSGLLATGIGG